MFAHSVISWPNGIELRKSRDKFIALGRMGPSGHSITRTPRDGLSGHSINGNRRRWPLRHFLTLPPLLIESLFHPFLGLLFTALISCDFRKDHPNTNSDAEEHFPLGCFVASIHTFGNSLR